MFVLSWRVRIWVYFIIQLFLNQLYH
jgi:hypothetical protein